MMTTLFKTSAVAALVMASASVCAVELDGGHEISVNASLVSNYIFRGVSLSDEDVAYQGGVDYAHDSGLYAGIWASSYDLDGDDEIEIDWYGGYTFAINDDVSVDVGAIRYYYADVGGHTTEWHVGLDLYGIGTALHYDQTLESWYGEVNYDINITEPLYVSLHGGYAEPDKGDGFYDLMATVGYVVHPNIDLYAGAAYHEELDDTYVVGVTFSY
ncbi:TorF family putative porin [Ferrimonas sp. SCSIO 43195]|uniref:TorF family putative porin n=1 Tax=Ferrimonas sp. SCSIO 43195 TaxID=2822844 RepID=UPI0020751E25|nr:TorF family putative porin [Ferrimonas sp. SCSIO 43195]USD37897.1 TorF family putative porin [Ferrimonas sp. SCSIO 43195]